MICDAAEGVGEPCLRIGTVELGGFNQRIEMMSGDLPPRSDPMNM
jgi:hypothetical protein